MARVVKLKQQALDQVIPVEEAIAGMERIVDVPLRLWTAMHERDVWLDAVAKLEEVAGVEPTQGAV